MTGIEYNMNYQRRTNEPFGLIVDIRPVVDKYRCRKELFPIFTVMSLNEIFEMILRAYYDQDYFEVLNFEIDERLDKNRSQTSDNEYIDPFLRDIFIEELLEDIDDILCRKTNNLVDYTKYRFENWISDYVIFLIKY